MELPEERRVTRYRGWFGGILGFIYFHLDLTGADGRPSHTKVLTTWGFFLTLGAEMWWLVYLSIKAARTDNITDLAGVITWPYVFLVVVTLALAMGRDTFKAALRMKLNGNGNRPRTPQRDEAP